MNQYIHIGAEVAAITALTIRFQKQLAQLEQRIELLESSLKQQPKKIRGPKVAIFDADPIKKPPDFFMSFFPLFGETLPEQSHTNTVSIEEILEEPKPENVKDIFLKHLAFLADPNSLSPDETNSLF